MHGLLILKQHERLSTLPWRHVAEIGQPNSYGAVASPAEFCNSATRSYLEVSSLWKGASDCEGQRLSVPYCCVSSPRKHSLLLKMIYSSGSKRALASAYVCCARLQLQRSVQAATTGMSIFCFFLVSDRYTWRENMLVNWFFLHEQDRKHLFFC